MINIIKVILFVLVNVAGFYAIPIVGSIAAKIDAMPSLPTATDYNTFKLWFAGGGLWVYGIGALASIGYFFTRDELKHWLLFAPMYLTVIYGVGVLIYFNYFFYIS